MVKKFTLMFLLGIFGLFSTNLFAQEDATIDPADIRFWIGEGQNEVIFIVNWAEPDTALAWGYRFNEPLVTVETVMDDIAAADSRFSYTGSNGWLSDIFFNDGVLNLQLVGQWWMYIVSGEMAGSGYTAQTVQNGDYIKWGDESCGIIVDPATYAYIWTKEVAAVYPLADEAMIDPSEIVYWIGEGENEVVFCVNWNEPNIALAWGFRFDADYTVETMMNTIENMDPRFSYETGDWGVTNIIFDDGDVHYSLVGDYWMYNINGSMAMLGFDQQPIINGDFIKWGDISCATEIAQWTYVWTQPVQPVSVYDNVNELEAATLSVYPNPATDRLYVNAENLQRVEIYDMAGRIVMTSVTPVVDLNGVEAGIYFVTVRTDNAAKTTKLVVK